MSEAKEALRRIEVEEGSRLAGKSLSELEDECPPVIIIAIRRGGSWMLNPGDDVRLYPGDVLVVKGKDEDVEEMKELARGGLREE